MNKKQYTTPQMEVIKLNTQNLLAASGTQIKIASDDEYSILNDLLESEDNSIWAR